MLKLALKNILNKKGRYGWLFAELVVAAVLGFVVLDPMVVSLYDRTRPYGYVRDGHVVINIATLPEGSRAFDPARTDSEIQLTDYLLITKKLEGLRSVARSMPLPFPILESASNTGGRMPVDTFEVFCGQAWFYPGTGYFTEMGITPAEGYTLKELDNLPADGRCVVTRSAYEMMPDTLRRKVVAGVVENVRPRSNMRNTNLKFYPVPLEPSSRVLVRLGDDADAKALHAELAEADLRSGNYYITEALTYDDLTREIMSHGNTDNHRLMEVFAAFFLFNLFLGVLGTFWLMTRKRTPEMGVMRAYGSTPCQARRLLFLEGAVLTVAAWAVGTLVTYLYLRLGDVSLAEGLSTGVYNDFSSQFFRCWVDNFGQHFAAIAGVTLAVLLAVVSVGILTPAFRLSRIRPIDALRTKE